MVSLQRLRQPPGADREINVTEGEYAKMAQFHFEHEEMSIQMVKMLFERNGIVISRYLEQEDDDIDRVIGELCEMFEAEHGRAPTDDEVKIWVSQINEANLAGASG